jgi:DNA-directed RNA polymerase II subunit RPB2
LKQDLIGIVASNNPIIILKDLYPDTNTYKYKVQLYIGGLDGKSIQISTPTVQLQRNLYMEKEVNKNNDNPQPKPTSQVEFTEDIGVLYPNEARLRNLTYAATVYADIIVKITYTPDATKLHATEELVIPEDTFKAWPLCTMPIMLHSSYCILHNKPKAFLKQVGECPYDNGGYFIVDGAEKVLITRQETAFNTLYISPQNDPKVRIFASIQCISTESRKVKRIAFTLGRQRKTLYKPLMRENSPAVYTHETIQVSLPFVRKPIPLFVLFRALGFQSDEEILHFIFPDFNESIGSEDS